MNVNYSNLDPKAVMQERDLMKRLRTAIGFCKAETGITAKSDQEMKHEQRMAMERCLVQNYLLKHGMDYFGKRDFIYLDMQSQEEFEAEGGDNIV